MNKKKGTLVTELVVRFCVSELLTCQGKLLAAV